MTFKVDIGLASDIGPRAANEDFAATSTPTRKTLAEKGLIAVDADGVSSAGGGRAASRMAVRGLIADYLSTPAAWDVSVALDRVLGALNDWLWAQNERADERAQMVTTLTAIVIRGRRFTVAHVGDSRAVLVRDGRTVQLTREHTHSDGVRQVLTRALGLDSRIVVDYSDGDLQLGDCFVLSTDGLHGFVSNRRLCEVGGELADESDLRRDLASAPRSDARSDADADSPETQAAAGAPAPAQSMAERLVALAIDGKTTDNASAVVLRVEGLAADSLQDSTHRMARLAVPPRLKVGAKIDGFAITRLVHDSGANLLYQARDVAGAAGQPVGGEIGGALVAIKTLHPLRAGDPDEIAALAYEDWVTAQMHGGHFAEKIDVGNRQTMNYLVYRWYAGKTLEQRIASASQNGSKPKPKIGVDEAIDIARQIAQALGQLHRRGIVHRDIKPDNLMLCDDGVLRVLDLGAATSGHEPEWMLGKHAGTPSYMNPEQWKGAPADAGSDLFALGVVLYRVLTGKLPYGEIEPYQLARYRHDPPGPARLRPDVPIWLDRIVLRAVALDPKRRFETAEEFLLALDRGSARLLNAPAPTPLIDRDPAMLWRIAAGVSLLLNALLIYFLVALPH